MACIEMGVPMSVKHIQRWEAITAQSAQEELDSDGKLGTELEVMRSSFPGH